MNTPRINAAALWPGAVSLGIGVYFLVLSARMTLGSWQNPGPGLWPTCLSVLISLVSLALLALALRKKPASGTIHQLQEHIHPVPGTDDAALEAAWERTEGAEEEGFTRNSRYPLYAVLGLAAFILLFERFGLSLPCLALLLFWTKLLGKERWRVAVPVSVGLTALIYIIFGWGLDVPFPDDILLFNAR
ncbi:tripartite tricarboxylate transporter TctB family protein [Cohnella sp. JJ-181]|uniref:tripartite tricarboxylate transporter TctB family protein n=1 Tax=Cohnella rhizoplanae TaxID=2974897 RepID=UPI0022FFA07C|nr:tripartite tricarboxylate transporter TctB family protein [Cohnella sp. JJ-181]CAI6082614.1 hypothetical protein COHCIP112018_03700 [Cohnella sp. JJ-181]